MNDCGGPASRLRARVRVVVTVIGALVGLGGCGGITSAAQLDARFVASVHADGRDVPRGVAGEATLVTAARKLCELRANHATVQQRRKSALTKDELATVTQAFAGDAQRFAALALETYCP